MDVRSVYARGPRVRIRFPKKGRTKQSFKDECDINLIMAKYQKTGALAHFNKFSASYGFATSEDFASAMRTVTIAQDMFDGLPSSIRNRFANDPSQFLEFVQGADNREEAIELGLFPAEQEGESSKLDEIHAAMVSTSGGPGSETQPGPAEGTPE